MSAQTYILQLDELTPKVSEESQVQESSHSLVIIGVAAIGLSILAYFMDGIVHLSRNLSPPWSPIKPVDMDNLKKVFYFLTIWLVLHCLVLIKGFQNNRRFKDFSLDFIALGLLSSTLLAGGFTVISLVGGQPLYAIPASLWLYFHLSLLIGKQSSRRME
jgi:hypothetical protein